MGIKDTTDDGLASAIRQQIARGVTTVRLGVMPDGIVLVYYGPKNLLDFLRQLVWRRAAQFRLADDSCPHCFIEGLVGESRPLYRWGLLPASFSPPLSPASVIGQYRDVLENEQTPELQLFHETSGRHAPYWQVVLQPIAWPPYRHDACPEHE